MSKTTDTTAKGQKEMHLPLEPLFMMLHSKGFQVRPDDYIEMLKAVERFGSADIDETAKYICPIVATDEAEQAAFYNVIEEYKKLNSDKKQVVVPPPVFPLWLKICLLVIGLILVPFLIYYFTIPVSKIFVPLPSHSTIVTEKGDTLQLDATELFNRNIQDTAAININWELEKGVSANGLHASHVFNTPGLHYVKRKFTSKTFTIPKNSDSLKIYVCEDLPDINIQLPEGPVFPKKKITVKASTDAAQGIVSSFKWRINNVAVTGTTDSIEHIFDSAGNYEIQCMAVVGSIASPCTQTGITILHVEEPGLHYDAKVSGKGNVYKVRTTLKTWVTLLLLLPAFAGFVYYFIRKRNKPSKEPEPEQKANTSKKPPYQVPFERNDIKLIKRERELRSIFLQMRLKAEEETLMLSVLKTIDATIRSGGMPALIYTPRTQQREYLVLVDRTNPKSMITQLFDYVANSMADENIPVQKFYYDENLKCFNTHFPLGITIQRLAELYSSSTLILFGKAHELVYRAYPVIEEHLLKELNKWENKAIITPVCFADWGEKEKVLSAHLLLLPADIKGLQKLMPAIKENQKKQENYLASLNNNFYRTMFADFREANEILAWLDNDEALFQWLCAVCLYPKLRWEVLIETGKTILEKYGQPEKLNYTNLLKLCRITWMEEGVFPQYTRLELLKRLNVENEIAARQTLLRMFKYQGIAYAEGYFFEDEKERQQLTNEFVLYASDEKKFSQYEKSKDRFKKLWETNAVLDEPIKKYLNNTDGSNWDTPVSIGDHPVSLDDYFNYDRHKKNKSSRKKFGVAAAAVLLIGVWGAMEFFTGLRNVSNIAGLLYTPGASQTVTVKVNVVKDFSSCGDSANAFFDTLSAYLLINGEQIPVSYSQNKTTGAAAFNLPYSYFPVHNAYLNLNWSGNRSVQTAISLRTDSLPATLTVSCRNIVEPLHIPVNIYYNSVAAKDLATTIIQKLPQGFDVVLSQKQFIDTGSVRIYYYNQDQEKDAQILATDINQLLASVIQPIQLDSAFSGSGSKQLEVYVNKQDACTPVAVSALPASLNEIWKSNTTNTLVNINLVQQVIYFATNAKNAYETYTNNEVCQMSSDKYKITSAVKTGYKVFFIRSITSQSFELSECSNIYKTKEETIDLRISACGNFNTMSLYYQNNPSVVYLPASNSRNLAAAQKAKLDKIVNTAGYKATNKTDFTISMSVAFSNKFLQVPDNNAITKYLNASKISYSVTQRNLSAHNVTDPFQRNYFVLSVKPLSTVKDNPDIKYTPDCNSTFTSIDETKKLASPLIVCKLDLSKANIATIPSEVYTFTNLQELNLGANTIPQKDIDRLRKSLPKCRIINTVALVGLELGYIEFDEYHALDSRSEYLLQRIAKQLLESPSSKITMETNYDGSKLAEYDVVAANIITLKRVLKEVGISQKSDQVPTAVTPSKKRANNINRIYITGINFPSNFNGRAASKN